MILAKVPHHIWILRNLLRYPGASPRQGYCHHHRDWLFFYQTSCTILSRIAYGDSREIIQEKKYFFLNRFFIATYTIRERYCSENVL